ncbi:MAG: MATE family efflux transporter [Bacteroidetes bacterium]|nr:MATE family efflux transporter [Bacteroidota bacterium]
MERDLKLDISYRQILTMALPISFAILVPQFNFLINSIFLSQLGEGYVGASGVTGVYYLIFSVIGFGLNNGIQALISRRAGQDRLLEIGQLFTQSVYLILSIALAGIFTTYFIAPLIFEQFTDPALYKQSMEFLHIRIWGLPFLYLYQMRNALLVGTNQSQLLIWGTLSETLTNVVLDYGLIFGHLGLPALGFNGAAYASVIAEFIGMAVVFLIIQQKGMKKRFGLFSQLAIDTKTISTILVQSSPLILQYAISIISWEYFFILISHDGRMELDISQLMRLVFGFCGIFIWAFAGTTNTMVSNIIGQGNQDKVLSLIRKIIHLSLGSSLFIVIPLLTLPELILSFYDTDPAFITMGVPVVRVVGVAILLMSVATVCLNAVTGTGNTRINLLIEFITIVMYCIFIYVVMHKLNLSLAWGWGSEWLYWSSILIMSSIYMLSGKWNNEKSRSV